MTGRTSDALAAVRARWRIREVSTEELPKLAQTFQHLETIVFPTTDESDPFVYGQALWGDVSDEPVATGWDWSFERGVGRPNLITRSLFSTVRLVDGHGVPLPENQSIVAWLSEIEGWDWTSSVLELVDEGAGQQGAGRALH